MPLAWAALVIGGIFLVSAWKGQPLLDTILGREGHIRGSSPADMPGVSPASPDTSPTDFAAPLGATPRAATLIALGHTAEAHGLNVHECDAPGAPARWGPVHKVHAPGSMHDMHRAFDASGSEAQMHSYCVEIHRTHKAALTQLIHNPGFAVYHGKDVGPAVYAAVWEGHKDHVHVGV